MNTNIVTEAGQAIQSEAANAFMEKLMDKSRNAIRDAFLESLSDEQYKAFVAREMDTFINGNQQERYLTTQESQTIYSKDQYDNLAAQFVVETPYREDTKGYQQHVVYYKRVPNTKYDPSKDKDTLPGMIREIIRSQVNKDMVNEIMNSPEMKTNITGAIGPGGGCMSIFEDFITKYLNENMHLIIKAEREMMLHTAIMNVLNQLRNNGGRGY
jgi:hypothetical protein